MLLGADQHIARGLALAQRGQHRINDPELLLCLLVAAACTLDQVQRAPLDAFEIGQHQLRLNRLGVADRVDRTLDMGDVAIGKAAQDLRDRIDLTNMRKELVAEPFAARGAADKPGDVDEFELGRDDLSRFREAGADCEPLVGHGDAPDIRLDRAERIIRRLCGSGRGEGVEQGRFADIRQADDAASESHGSARLI